MDLIQLRNRIQTIPTLEARKELLLEEIKKAEADVTAQLVKCEKESRDVELIQKESLSSFLFKLIGKYEDKLEKEQREEIASKLAYDRAVTRLDDLVRERNDLNSRIASLQDEERAYNTELSNRRQELAQRFKADDGIRYTQLESQRNAIISQIAEIKEALAAASRTKSTAQITLESLKSAQGWATYDAFARGGIISHMLKYSHIDNAEANFHTLSSQLHDLKCELKDVHGFGELDVNEISSVERTLDFWFDNIFTDLSVRGQIKDNVHQISNLIDDINKTQDTLEKELYKQEAMLNENRRLEEQLLLTLNMQD